MKTEVSSSFPLVCAGERGDDDLVEGRGETRACLKISTEYLLLWLENTNEVDCRGRKTVEGNRKPRKSTKWSLRDVC